MCGWVCWWCMHVKQITGIYAYAIAWGKWGLMLLIIITVLSPSNNICTEFLFFFFGATRVCFTFTLDIKYERVLRISIKYDENTDLQIDTFSLTFLSFFIGLSVPLSRAISLIRCLYSHQSCMKRSFCLHTRAHIQSTDTLRVQHICRCLILPLYAQPVCGWMILV